jgi:menaquinone-9 beta-reductase
LSQRRNDSITPSLVWVTSPQQVQDVDRSCDVLVVGAGPAGIAAAIGAHRGGHSVIVVDKAVFPRDKCCGDGLTTLALRELERLGLVPEQVSNWMDVDAAWLRSPSGREVRVPLPANGRYAAIAPRIDLDAALVRHARELGVEIAEGHGVETTANAVRDRGTAIDVAVSGIGIVRARQVIAADGMWSPVRKALNLNEPGYLGEWHAFRQYAHQVDGPAAHRLYVWFEKDLLPGYAWSFPLPGGRVNIGFGVLRSEGRRTKEMGSCGMTSCSVPTSVRRSASKLNLKDVIRPGRFRLEFTVRCCQPHA